MPGSQNQSSPDRIDPSSTLLSKEGSSCPFYTADVHSMLKGNCHCQENILLLRAVLL